MSANETPRGDGALDESAGRRVQDQCHTDRGRSHVAVSVAIEVDLRTDHGTRYDEAPWAANRRLRAALADALPSDHIKIIVNRWSLIPTEMTEVIPAGARVQVTADCATTARQWEHALRSEERE